VRALRTPGGPSLLSRPPTLDLSIDVPICSDCNRTVEHRRKVINRLFVALAIGIPLITFLLIRLALGPRNLSSEPFLCSGPLFSLYFVVWGWLLTRRAANVDFARFRRDRSLRFTNPSYQQRFEGLNEGSSLSRKRPLIVDLLGYIGLSAFAGGLLYFLVIPNLIAKHLAHSIWWFVGPIEEEHLAYSISVVVHGLVFGLVPAVFAVGFTWDGIRPVRWGKLVLCVALGIAAGAIAGLLRALTRGANEIGISGGEEVGVAVVVSALASSLLVLWLLPRVRDNPVNP